MTLEIKEYKPRIIVDTFKAFKLTTENIVDAARVVNGKIYSDFKYHDFHVETKHYISFFGLDGVIDAHVGDYIVEGPHGVFRTEIAKRFERKYEEA